MEKDNEKRLEELKKSVRETDDRILELFRHRMDISKEMAGIKKECGIPGSDISYERNRLAEISKEAGDEYSDYAYSLFSNIMDLGRTVQTSTMTDKTPLESEIESAIKNTPALFPENVIVACQGVEGAYSQQACDKLFLKPSIMYFSNFEGVFSAVANGLCQYGVLPLENSTAGSVNQIYDLMMKYNFFIIRSTRLKIDHNLLVKPGTRKEDIREIYSHEQALNQSAEFLKSMKNARPVVCANTALAAKMVAESDRNDVAALSSISCAELYGLKCLEYSVQDKGNNYTKFICISKNMEIYPGADKTSIMMTLPHRPGSLYKVLGRFYALNINLLKLESRPMPDRDFEFMFYFDIESSVYSGRFSSIMAQLEEISEEFKYLGSYSEVI